MFAQRTSVPVAQSRAEIERMLSRHKCTQFLTGCDYEKAVAKVQFKAHNRIIRFVIALPKRSTFSLGPSGAAKFEQAERQKWRALLLVIKAKLECVENAIATFDEEFLAHIVMPNDRTVFEIITPQIDSAYLNGKMPRMLEATNEETT